MNRGVISLARRLFRHGKWPRILVGLHYYSMISIVLLIASGLALYLPIVHTPLIPYLPYIYDLHILLGIIFAITLVTPFLKWLPRQRPIWRLDWWFPTALGGGIVVTGLLLWGVTLFPSTWRGPSFTWHGVLSYVLGGWLIIHAFLKTFGLRFDPDGPMGRVDPTRRRFLKYVGVGVVGAAILAVFQPFASLARWWAGLGTKGANPPPISSSSQFAAFYTVTGTYPSMPLDEYQLTVNGLVSAPITLDWESIRKLPATTETVNFQCVTGWSVPNVKWEGVHIADLVRLVRPLATAKYVHFYSFDGVYTESLSLKEALAKNVLLAYRLNDKPLPVPQGAPVRMVVPDMYGYKSIKWVNRVEFADAPLTGYWEARGYPNQAYIGSAGFF